VCLGKEKKGELGDKIVNAIKGVKDQLGKMNNGTKQEISGIAQEIKEKLQGKNSTDTGKGQLGGFVQVVKDTIQKLSKGK
jgi:hypothetical protein